MANETFRVIAGNAAGTELELGDELQIGRVAPDPGKLGDDPELSRSHARVSRNAQGQVVIEDLGSTNGTIVNGQRIAGPTLLNPGDTVKVGRSTLQLQAAGAQATQIGGAAAAGAVPPAAAAGPPPPTQPPAATPPPPPTPPPATAPQPAPTQPLGTPFAPGAGAPGRPPTAGGGSNSRRNLLIALGGLAALAIVAVLVIVLAGGDDGGGDDEKAVRDTIAAAFNNDCDAFSSSYRDRVFGGSSECEDAADDAGKPDDFEISKVEIDGDSADAEAEADGTEGSFELARSGDDWEITDIDGDLGDAIEETGRAARDEETETTTTPATPTTPEPEPETTEEQDPREIEAIATLQALIKAVQEDDEAVFCGLLSPRQAQKLVGGPGGDAAIARCVEVAGNVDLSRGVPRRVSVTGVRVTGNQASVRLTTGERFTLVRRRGRFVIDCCLG